MKNNQTIKENFDFAFENHKKNNLEVAEKLYKKILEIDPNHYLSTVLLGTLSAQTKNFDLAKQLLEGAIKINPNHPDYERRLKAEMSKIWIYCEECKKKYCLGDPCMHHLPDGYKNDLKRKAYFKKRKESKTEDTTSNQDLMSC